MLLAIIIIDLLSLLLMAVVLLGAKRVFSRRRYLLCSLMHEGHSPEKCKNLPIMNMGKLAFFYILMTMGIVFLSLFIYFNA